MAEGKDKRKKSSGKKSSEEKTKKQTKSDEQKIMLDITWVAVLVLVAFFVGFLVRGMVMPAQSSTPTPQFSPTPQMQAPPLPEGVTTLPPGHPPIPGMQGGGQTTTMTPPQTAPSTGTQ